MEASLHMRGSLGEKKVVHQQAEVSPGLGIHFFMGASQTTFIPRRRLPGTYGSFHHPSSCCFRGFPTARRETTPVPFNSLTGELNLHMQPGSIRED